MALRYNDRTGDFEEYSPQPQPAPRKPYQEKHTGGSSGNSGCWWFAIIVAAVFFFASLHNSNKHTSNVAPVQDTTAVYDGSTPVTNRPSDVETVVEEATDTVAVDTNYVW